MSVQNNKPVAQVGAGTSKQVATPPPARTESSSLVRATETETPGYNTHSMDGAQRSANQISKPPQAPLKTIEQLLNNK